MMTKLQLQLYDLGYAKWADDPCIEPDDYGEYYKATEVDAALKEQADEVYYWKNIAKSALAEKKSKLKQIKQLQARIAKLEDYLPSVCDRLF